MIGCRERYAPDNNISALNMKSAPDEKNSWTRFCDCFNIFQKIKINAAITKIYKDTKYAFKFFCKISTLIFLIFFMILLNCPGYFWGKGKRKVLLGWLLRGNANDVYRTHAFPFINDFFQAINYINYMHV